MKTEIGVVLLSYDAQKLSAEIGTSSWNWNVVLKLADGSERPSILEAGGALLLTAFENWKKSKINPKIGSHDANIHTFFIE